MAEHLMTVELVYADAHRQLVQRIEVAEGTRVNEAIETSGIADSLPPGAIDPDRLGIFSRRVTADHILQHGDRVEIYRPLLVDPMQARRRRAR